MNGPQAPQPTLIPGTSGHILLRRVMNIRGIDQQDIERLVLVENDTLEISLHDTGSDGTPRETAARDTAIHLLWAMDDDAAHLSIGNDTVPIAPGDMIALPCGTVWTASRSLILCVITRNSDRETVAPHLGPALPTHGSEIFHGYNRETVFPSPSDLAITRWKITQPLVLPPASTDRYIVDLAAPVALYWPGGTDLIGRGECRHIPPECGPITLLPDGLGYVLIVDRGLTP